VEYLLFFFGSFYEKHNDCSKENQECNHLGNAHLGTRNHPPIIPPVFFNKKACGAVKDQEPEKYLTLKFSFGPQDNEDQKYDEIGKCMVKLGWV